MVQAVVWVLALDQYQGQSVALDLYQDQSVGLYRGLALVPAVCSGQRNRPWPESRSSCSSGH